MTSVTFPSENAKGPCPGVMDGDVTKTTKGLIVLQEWWGMNEQIKTAAHDIGMLGNFVTLVPDLYRGKMADDREEAGHLMSGLDWPGAVSDIKGAAEFLLSKGCTKVGVTGFCLGGALSLAAGALLPPSTISAAAPFYGIPKAQHCDVSTITIPVQAHFGDKDPIKGFSSLEDAMVLKAKQSNNKNFELFIYLDTGHAFTNVSGPNYNKEMCDLALGRLVEFMNKHLK